MATMVHRELPGRTIDVPVDAVPMYMASGWVPVDGKAVEAAEAAARAEAEQKAKNDKLAAEAISAAEEKDTEKDNKAAAPAKATKAAKES